MPNLLEVIGLPCTHVKTLDNIFVVGYLIVALNAYVSYRTAGDSRIYLSRRAALIQLALAIATIGCAAWFVTLVPSDQDAALVLHACAFLVLGLLSFVVPRLCLKER